MKNVPQFNPADISSEYALLNAIIKDYLAKNLATVQPVQVIKVYEDNGFLDVSPLIQKYRIHPWNPQEQTRTQHLFPMVQKLHLTMMQFPEPLPTARAVITPASMV